MKPALETGISNLADASFKAFRLHQQFFNRVGTIIPNWNWSIFPKGKE